MKLLDNKIYIEDVRYAAEYSLPWDKMQNKKLLITGACGLIGSFAIDVLMEKNKSCGINCKIYALGRNKEAAKERFANYWDNPLFCFLCHDVNNPLEEKTDENFDYIIHLASCTHPMAYAQNPVATIATNVFGTDNLLKYAVRHHAQRFVFASSNEIYGENRGDVEFFNETYCGYVNSNTLRAGYPESKRCGEALCQAYLKEREIDVVIPRFTRTYGPSMLMSDTKAVSQFILKAVRGENIVLKSDGKQYYSYTYVVDAVTGLFTVMLCGHCGEAYNIADSRSDIMLKDLAKIASEISHTKVVFDIPNAIEKTGYSTATKARLDGSKLKSLGWDMKYDIYAGMERTIGVLKNMSERQTITMDINTLREKLNSSRNIYIYGAGLTGINYLQKFGRQLPSRPIQGIIVSDKKDNPEKIGSFNVVPLSELHVRKETAFFWITAGTKHQEGIIQRLEEAGYSRYAIPNQEIWDKLYMLEKHDFIDRRKLKDKVLFVLAGYKEFLWRDVFERLEKYIPDDVEVCVLSSGLKSGRLAEIAEKNEWSYLSTSYNSVTMIQNIAMEYYQKAQWFYKLDEDIFLTEGTLDSMMRTFITAQKLEPYNIGVVAPLIPLNGYGYIRILDKLGLRDEYEKRFDKVLSGGYPDKKIESDIEAAAFMWGATGEIPRLDNLNRKFSSSYEQDNCYKHDFFHEYFHEYSFCNVRFSIGCILYNRDFWDKMGSAYPYGTGQPGDVGEDEVHMCARTVLKSYALVVDESSVVGHFSFGAQTEGMKDYYVTHHELFEIQ